MGAGWQRWWRDQADIEERRDLACALWRSEREAALSRAIVRAPRRDLPIVKAAVKAWAALWTYLRGDRG